MLFMLQVYGNGIKVHTIPYRIKVEAKFPQILFLQQGLNTCIMKIAVAKGDGIGPEIMEAVLSIFRANGVGLEYEYVEMGKWVFDKGFSNGMTPEAQQSIEALGIL